MLHLMNFWCNSAYEMIVGAAMLTKPLEAFAEIEATRFKFA